VALRSSVSSLQVRLRKKPPTPAEVVGEEILGSQYGQEAEQAVALASELMHVTNLVQLIMEGKKEKASLGLGGSELERDFYRTDSAGEKTSVAHFVVLAVVGRRLLESFPDDAVLCEDDVMLLERDADFLATVTKVISEFGLCEEATQDDVLQWVRHCSTALEQDEPKRFWAIKPIDTFEELREQKPYVSSVALVEDGQPVVSAVAAPTIPYDHPSRSSESRRGSPIFFAVKGHGAYTQHVIVENDDGSYKGKCYMRGFREQLKAGEKIVRAHDGLWDYLGAEQLHISMSTRMREDIFLDAQRIGKELGSQYPKFEFANSSLKYCLLARGQADVCWWLARGLYDKSKGTEHLVDHVAGCLIASEAGAEVADLDGNPVEWVVPILKNNRGLLACDPSKIPLKGIITAIETASSTSEVLFEERVQKKKEVAKLLAHIFNTVGDFAETDEEKEACKKVMERGNKLLSDEEEMMKITQDMVNREAPLLGEGPQAQDTFGNEGDIPLSPISPS